MNLQLVDFFLNQSSRLASPIGVYAGLEITGASVQQAVSDGEIQAKAVLALNERFHTPFLLTAMDLSAEAEAFGSKIRMSDDEIPTVIGRLVTDRASVDALPIPDAGKARTAVHLSAARFLVEHGGGVPVLGGIIGPFSLAGRLFGVSELLELTIADPDLAETILEKATEFIKRYLDAFRATGAAGVIMAEPAAGLLSPRGLARFSSVYVKRLADECQRENFSIVYHNCGAKLVHLKSIQQTGLSIFHFGAPMDITKALQQVPPDVIIGGNLDPTAVFHSGTPDLMRESTRALLAEVGSYRNFFASSGCDLPPGTPTENLDIFFQEVARYNSEK